MAQKTDIIQIVREIENKEIILIELQGSLEHSIEKSFHDMYLGKLEHGDNNDYTLTIGNHILVGKKMELKNPFILCSKCHKNEKDNKIKILNIIKNKISFNLRPTPILSNN
jgi:hypothetical protein